jgi:hypothetical protein
MSHLRDPRANRWLRRYAVGIVVSLALTVAITILGRHGHRTEALVTLASIHLIAQAHGVLCLWRVTCVVLRLGPARSDL